MRLRIIASSCLLIAVSAGGVSTLAASPDCARWIRDYQQGLAKRAVLAKKNVVRAAKRVPRPRMMYASTPVRKLRPAKLSPQEMLKRFRVLCGDDLPDEPISVSFVPTSLDALLIPPVSFPDTAPVTDVGRPVSFSPVPEGTPQVQPSPAVTGATPSLPVASTPVIPNVPVIPSQVPEPNSLVFLVTGALGAIPLVRRRLR